VAQSSYSYIHTSRIYYIYTISKAHAYPCTVTRNADHSCHSADFYLAYIDFAPPFFGKEKNYIIFAHTAGHDYKSMGLECSVKSVRFSILGIFLG
jgi:hypothetical protein